MHKIIFLILGFIGSDYPKHRHFFIWPNIIKLYIYKIYCTSSKIKNSIYKKAFTYTNFIAHCYLHNKCLL